MASLCERCELLRVVISGKGSRFLLCRQSGVDPRYPKYPPQPVRSCEAFLAVSGQQSKPISMPPE